MARWVGLLAVLWVAEVASAEPFGRIPVQGRLTDANGAPVDGQREVRFALYGRRDRSVILWEDTFPVTFTQGGFAAYLGDGEQALDLALFQDGPDVWLGLTVEDDSEMGLIALGTVPFAAWASRAGDAATVGGRTVDDVLAEVPSDRDIQNLALGVCLPTTWRPSWLEVLDRPETLADGVILWSEIQSLPPDFANGEIAWDELRDVPAWLVDGSVAWSEVTGIPADLADGGVSWDEIVDVPLDYADGETSWDELVDLPAPFADGEVAWTEIRTLPADLVDGDINWSELSGIPADFADGGVSWDELIDLPLVYADGETSWDEIVDLPTAFADGVVAWSELTSLPADLADGDVAWSELSGVPTAFADGDIGWSELSGVSVVFADGDISWSEISGVPADLLDGDDTLVDPGPACGAQQVVSWDGSKLICVDVLGQSEIFVRGSSLSASGTTLEGLVLSGSTLVASQGGYGTGEDDLVVSGTTLTLEPGVYEYNNITVSSGGRILPRVYNGVDGGKVILRARGKVVINSGTSIDASNAGYRGGFAEWAQMTGEQHGAHGHPGESWLGQRTAGWEVSSNNVGGGGGGGGYDAGNYGCAGAGGGYGTSGSTAPACPGNSSFRATGGATYGDARLSVLHLGSGGGASGSDEDHRGRGGHGGTGGGAILIEADTIEVRGSLFANGANGTGATIDNNGGGGGGAGGSILLRGRVVTVFSGGVVRANGGSGGAQVGGGGVGGAGGEGRIYVDAGTWTNSGTVSPTPTTDTGSTRGQGDGGWSRWTSDTVSFTGSGRYSHVDLFATRGPNTDVQVEFRAASTSSGVSSATWVPVSTSGAMDVAANLGFGQVRVTVWDRGPKPTWKLHGIRVAVVR